MEGGGGSPDKIKSQHTRTKEEREKAREEKRGGDASPVPWIIVLPGTAPPPPFHNENPRVDL